MLKSYIGTVPNTKFILLTDTLECRDKKLLDYIIRGHIKQKHKVHFCVFEGVFRRTQDKFKSDTNILFHDYVCKGDYTDFEVLCSSLLNNEVIVIDSLANCILRYGLSPIYKIFNSLRINKAIRQIITVLHKDLLSSILSQASIYFKSLATLSIDVQPKFMTDSLRLHYEYKKRGGRIISEIEEYRFEEDSLVTSKVVKPDAVKLLDQVTLKEVNPEELSTFRIGLTDEEKLSRDKVILPYLPSAPEELSSGEGKIFYKLDEVDDWDEEDPDDDLDI